MAAIKPPPVFQSSPAPKGRCNLLLPAVRDGYLTIVSILTGPGEPVLHVWLLFLVEP